MKSLLRNLQEDYLACSAKHGPVAAAGQTTRVLSVARILLLEYSSHSSRMLGEVDLLVTLMLHSMQPYRGDTDAASSSDGHPASGVMLCCVLCCTVLYCAVLRCAVLCCAVLCCAVLCCAVLCCAVLCCAMLCCAMCCFFAKFLLLSFSHSLLQISQTHTSTYISLSQPLSPPLLPLSLSLSFQPPPTSGTRSWGWV